MLKGIISSGVVIGAVLFAALYAILRVVLGLDAVIILFNGAFIGAGITFMIAFYRLFLDAIVGNGEYDRVRQMAVSMIVIWAAVSCLIIASITVRIQGAPVNLVEWSAAGRYLAVMGGIAQVTSPDVGEPLFQSRDHKLLIFAVIVGTLVAVALMVLQT